jgi:hypothetical protein
MIEVYETIGYLVLGFLSVMWLTKIAKCSLRDYFAAKALPQCFEVSTTTDIAAKEAYRMADAMMKARTE